jgi:hypothetical protein
MKKIGFGLIIISVLVLSVNVLGAEKTSQEAIQDNQEMRKNVTWTTEGLYQLGKSKNKRLALTREQARRILPLYQELIDKKIILIETNLVALCSNPSINLNSPNDSRYFNLSAEEEEKSTREIVLLTEFGKQQLRRINNILSKEQIEFINNLDFKPEKYGYFEMGRPQNDVGQKELQGNQSKGQFRDGWSGNPTQNDQIRQKHYEAQKLLVQLNLDVLNILKKR